MNSTQTLTCAALALAATSLVGCFETTDGELGNLSFSDETSGLEDRTDRTLARTLAVGATLPVHARCDDGSSASLVAVTTQDDAVVDVRLGMDDGLGDLVLVDAIAPGTATIEVQSQCGDDRFTITTGDAASAELRWTPFSSLFAPPASMWADGVALLPDAPIDVRARRFDADGDEMTGYGGLQWSVTSEDEALAEITSRTASRMGDAITLRSGDAAGTGTLDAGLGEGLPFAVVTMDDVAQLGLADIEAEIVVDGGGTLEIPADRELYVLHLAAWTADGAWIAGAGDAITMTVTEGDEALLTPYDWTDLVTDDEDQADLARMLENGRTLVWTTGAAGEVTVEIAWGEQTATFEVVITDADAATEGEGDNGAEGGAEPTE